MSFSLTLNYARIFEVMIGLVTGQCSAVCYATLYERRDMFNTFCDTYSTASFLRGKSKEHFWTGKRIVSIDSERYNWVVYRGVLKLLGY